MILTNPVVITSRLLPGVNVGDAEISIEYHDQDREGRTIYRYYLDSPEIEYEGNDLESGCQGGNLQEGLESLLSFMGQKGESWKYFPKPQSDDLFPPDIMEFCSNNADEIAMLQCKLEETSNLIEE